MIEISHTSQILKIVKSVSKIKLTKDYTKGGARSEKNLYSEIDKCSIYSTFIVVLKTFVTNGSNVKNSNSVNKLNVKSQSEQSWESSES